MVPLSYYQLHQLLYYSIQALVRIRLKNADGCDLRLICATVLKRFVSYGQA